MKIAIVGAGNMGTAILNGFKAAGENDLITLNPVNPRVEKFTQAKQIQLVNTPTDLVKAQPAIVILTTPASITLEVASQLASLNEETIIISSAAGISLAALAKALPNHPLAAMIPNTPVAVNAGTIGLALRENLPATITVTIKELLGKLGDVIVVKETDLNIIGVVGGCGPAFVDVLMDAFSDAAVKHGLSRQIAYQVVASMVKGSGTLATETGFAPALLRDQVTSPGGTTIKGISALEAHGFRGAAIAAIDAASDNSATN